MTQPTYILAIDQGTTSSRAICFDRDGVAVPGSVAQVEHEQFFPRAGWLEHDPLEIWRNTRTVMAESVGQADLGKGTIAGIGITNQRETVVVWDRYTGEPVHRAIVWQDARTSGICARLAEGHEAGEDRFRGRTGLPLSTYFSGPKIKWILDNVDGARERAEDGSLLAGTMDSWLVWNLTGGARGRNPAGQPLHVTDVTNASRTMLMDLHTLEWSPEICEAMGIPMSMLPEIVPSSGALGEVASERMFGGIPIAGILGDQQAAMFGQSCFAPGETKNTYGTGAFLLTNTGDSPQFSENGLLTTVCYQLQGRSPVYALEGSIAVAGSVIQWLRDNLGILSHAAESEDLARSIDDNGDCYLVPAFSGLLAPHWRPDARGAVVGLTRFHTRAHLARAALESTAFQTREVAEAMAADAGESADELRVDGGMVANEFLMQFQADMLGVTVVRPVEIETTALGAAYAAGLGVGLWENTDQLRGLWSADRRWEPAMEPARREHLWRRWRAAVERTFDWAPDEA